MDRSAAYAARYVAKNIVAAGLATTCEVQVAYAIGVAKPVSVYVDTFGTGKLSSEALETLVNEHFDLTPAGIIRTLDLLKPRYKATATHGHFGRKGDGLHLGEDRQGRSPEGRGREGRRQAGEGDGVRKGSFQFTVFSF